MFDTMEHKNDEPLQRFIEALRSDSDRGPGRGVRRMANFVRNGAGLATSVLAGRSRGENAMLNARDLQRVQTLVSGLGELKGLPMKIGQIMSYLELEMPEEARQLMSLLQTQSAATPFDRIEVVLREDLGDGRAEQLLDNLEREPISIASIGQVHRGRLPDKDGTVVAVKVRHPDIEDAIRSDFKLAAAGTGLASALIPGMGATARDFCKEIEARLVEECDYMLEAERQRLFGSIYADHPVIVVPQVHDQWCRPRVLVTTWQSGREFEPFRSDAATGQQQRDRAGAALFDFYIGTLYRHGLFHADPHPGNYHFCEDGKVVVFDYGCVRVFDREAKQSFIALAGAVRSDDRESILAALKGLGAEPSSNDAAYKQLRRLLRNFFKPMLNAGSQPIDGRIVIDMRQMMSDKLAIARLRLPGSLMFLFRIRFGLYAVLSRLGSICDWAAMERGYAEENGL
ncbi:MAG: AarF/ABC1/UbiB kinase family protein [Deltaproteobacteria bacterium]|nr:AarF/ABC1/UbiB kinase family protein [Deltaproteobacteria bacterium]